MHWRRIFVVSFDVSFVDKAYVKAYDKVGLRTVNRLRCGLVRTRVLRLAAGPGLPAP